MISSRDLLAHSVPSINLLPYAHDALSEFGMSKETLEFHHDLHHKAYVDNGNKLIEGTEWANKSLEEIIVGTYQAGSVAQNGIFNNASQHWNQNFHLERMIAPKAYYFLQDPSFPKTERGSNAAKHY